MVDDFFNNEFDVFVFDKFFIVGVHLFEEVDAAHIVGEVILCHLENTFEFLFVLVVVPHQHCQEVVSRIQGPNCLVVAWRQRFHNFQEAYDYGMVILTLYQVLIQLEVAVLFSDYHKRTIHLSF